MGRAPCCDKNGLKKGPWTPEEDLKLVNYIQTHGPGNWRSLPKNAELERCGKSCRLRWTNYLRPDIKRGRFSFEEEETIIQLHSVLGNKWSAIAARLPGRTDNEIKNYWNTHIRKRLIRMGIDPVTHAPRLDYLDLSSIFNSALCNPALVNLSTLLGNQALINPDVIRLLSSLLSIKQESPSSSILSKSLQEDQLCSQINSNQIQNQLAALLLQQNKFQTPSSNVEGFQSTSSHENMMPSNHGTDLLVNQHNYNVNCISSDNPTVHSHVPELNSYLGSNFNNINNQNLSFDSVMSTPMSSPTQLNSSSTYNINTEDERESFCNNLFEFEFPESWDINDFL